MAGFCPGVAGRPGRCGLVIVTGVNSIAFFMFPVLIILNALSIPLAMPQIVLNLFLSAFYLLAVMFTPSLNPKELLITAAPIHTTVLSRQIELRGGVQWQPGNGPAASDSAGGGRYGQQCAR